MAHDLIIRGGQLVDGSGREPVPEGLTINGERTVEVRRQRR